MTNKTVRAAIHANQWSDFRVYENGDMANYHNQSRLYQRYEDYVAGHVVYEPYPDIEMMQMQGGITYFRVAGWGAVVKRRRLRLPLIGGKAAPRDDPTRYFIDTSFR